MNIKSSMFYKIFVPGVILLFIGIIFQPVIAVNPISSDNEDDCDICPKVSNLQVVEKYKELYDGITTLKKINKVYVSDLFWNFPISCGILKIIAILFENISNVLINLPRTPVKVLITMTNVFFIIARLGDALGCWDFQ